MSTRSSILATAKPGSKRPLKSCPRWQARIPEGVVEMRAHYLLIGFATAVIAAWLLGSCAENPTDVPIPNKAPVVSISAGPIRDSVDVFIVTFNWNASDEDGQISHFFFAFDDRFGELFRGTCFPGDVAEPCRVGRVPLSRQELGPQRSVRLTDHLEMMGKLMNQRGFQAGRSRRHAHVDDAGRLVVPGKIIEDRRRFEPQVPHAIRHGRAGADESGVDGLGQGFAFRFEGDEKSWKTLRNSLPAHRLRRRCSIRTKPTFT